jgi:hypothetical protein
MPESAPLVDHRVQRFPLTPRQRAKTVVKSVLGLSGTKTVQILAGPARGVTMTLDFQGHTPLFLGMYELELHEFCRRALRGARLVFDVGGYIGYDALMFACNSSRRVVTFEPDGARRPALEDNISRNAELASRIIVNPFALGSEEGAGATTLDSVTAGLGEPDFIKIDVDGGEVDVLLGGSDLLRGRRPHLIVETHSLELERESGALLTEYGYSPVIKHNRRIWREFRGGAPHNRWLLARGDDSRRNANG